MDIKVRPGGLRLKFEPRAQPVFVQYKGERAAFAASGFSRGKTHGRRIIILSSETLPCLAQDARNNGRPQR